MSHQATPALGDLSSQILTDLGASPTPYHAVDRVSGMLRSAGFEEVDLSRALKPGAGGRYIVNGGSLVAWVQADEHRPFTIVGAHTDSPNLRVKAAPMMEAAKTEQVAMEIYGGVLLNSWLDRGLGLAGRVTVRNSSDDQSESRTSTRLVLDDRPLFIIPQLAIHLDREISISGLKLNPQKELTPIWASASGAQSKDKSTQDRSAGSRPATGRFGEYLGELLDVAAQDLLAWDLMAFDTQAPAVVGIDGEFFSSARIDNLLSCFCATRALIDLAARSGGTSRATTPIMALYDHEEIGSVSATGAAGSYLANLLERIAGAQGADRSSYLASLPDSLVISADGAHATHPNFADRHDPNHQIALNEGIVIKRNANQRYATDAVGEAKVVAICQDAGIPVQWYIHRNDLPCGSTIGPTTAAQLGVTTVDIGAPQWAMHSARETAGVADIGHLTNTLRAIWAA